MTELLDQNYYIQKYQIQKLRSFWICRRYPRSRTYIGIITEIIISKTRVDTKFLKNIVRATFIPTKVKFYLNSFGILHVDELGK